MKYKGSKSRLAKHILPIILSSREGTYVEPFCGGCNTIDKVDGGRYASDSSRYLIAMWKAMQLGWVPPDYVTKERYKEIRTDPEAHEDCMVGWVGFNCSYSGVFFGGFAGDCKTKDGKMRHYQAEAWRNVESQVLGLKGVQFSCHDYRETSLDPGSTIYLDPPYRGTSAYKAVDVFDHDAFWQWCRDKASEGHKVWISEYAAPDDFKCVWSQRVRSSLSANGRGGGSKVSVERLWVPGTF